MNYTTVFECININIFTIILASIVAIVLYLALILVAIIWLKHEAKKNKSSKIKKYFLSMGIISGIIFSISSMLTIVQAPIYKNNLYNEYIAGNTILVEGYAIVETFTDEDGIERISSLALNDVNFNTSSKYMYNYSNADDICISNNDYVRITYVSYKNNNFVMKIEKTNN